MSFFKFYKKDTNFGTKDILFRVNEISHLPLCCDISLNPIIIYNYGLRPHGVFLRDGTPIISQSLYYKFYFPGFKEVVILRMVKPSKLYSNYVEQNNFQLQIDVYSNNQCYGYLSSLLANLLIEQGFCQNEYLNYDTSQIEDLHTYFDEYELDYGQIYFSSPDWISCKWDDKKIPFKSRLKPMEKMPTFKNYFPIGGRGY